MNILKYFAALSLMPEKRDHPFGMNQLLAVDGDGKQSQGWLPADEPPGKQGPPNKDARQTSPPQGQERRGGDRRKKQQEVLLDTRVGNRRKSADQHIKIKV